MPFHDVYARLTPLELAFPDLADARAWADEVFREAAELGVDPLDPGAFMTLGSVGSRLQQLGGPDVPGATLLEYVTLAFHLCHFERAGRPLLLVDTPLARWLTRAGQVEGSPKPPLPAAYVQLPKNLFWMHDEPPGPAEAADGFFWTVSGGLLHVLLATGMRDGRAGLGVAPLAAAPLTEARAWLSATLRDGGADYASTLPGGDMEDLYSFTTAGEVLKLLARLFAHVGAHPDAVVSGQTPSPDAVPAPSALAYRRITLAGATDA